MLANGTKGVVKIKSYHGMGSGDVEGQAGRWWLDGKEERGRVKEGGTRGDCN